MFIFGHVCSYVIRDCIVDYIIKFTLFLGLFELSRCFGMVRPMRRALTQMNLSQGFIWGLGVTISVLGFSRNFFGF